jgi:hypothetical protein
MGVIRLGAAGSAARCRADGAAASAGIEALTHERKFAKRNLPMLRVQRLTVGWVLDRFTCLDLFQRPRDGIQD